MSARRPEGEDLVRRVACLVRGGNGCEANASGFHRCSIAPPTEGTKPTHLGRHRCRCGEEFTAAEVDLDEALWVIAAERRRALNARPEQTYANGTGGPWATMFALESKGRVDDARAAGSLTWRDVLDLKVAQASAQEDPIELAGRLAQVAVVCALWMEDIRRQVRAAELDEARRRAKERNKR